MEDMNEVEAGDIFAIFGAECSTGDTLAEGNMTYLARCTTMHVPAPVISLRFRPKKT
jgi:elongation factor G